MAEGPAPASAASAVGTQVKKEALPKLLNLLAPVACGWDLFAQQIGVPPDRISQIKVANPQTGPNYLYRCFNQALEWWVANHDNPVYETMIGVLDPGPGKVTPAMNRVLANELREFMVKQQAVMYPIPGSVDHYTHPGLHAPTALKEEYTQANQVMIRGKFACLLEFMEMKLQQKLAPEIIERKLRLFVIRLFNVPDSSIPVSSDISVIFEAMRSHKLLTYLNIAGLEQIIKHFCEGDSEVKIKMEQYKKDRSGFELATKIKDSDYISKARSTFPYLCATSPTDILPKRTPAYLEELAVKLEHRVAEYHLDYLRELWESLSAVLSLPPLYLILDAVIMNSILVVWLIPTAVVSEATKRAKQNADFFKKYPILKVTIGDDCVYNTTEPTVLPMAATGTHPASSGIQVSYTRPALESRPTSRRAHGEYEGEVLGSELLMDHAPDESETGAKQRPPTAVTHTVGAAAAEQEEAQYQQHRAEAREKLAERLSQEKPRAMGGSAHSREELQELRQKQEREQQLKAKYAGVYRKQKREAYQQAKRQRENEEIEKRKQIQREKALRVRARETAQAKEDLESLRRQL